MPTFVFFNTAAILISLIFKRICQVGYTIKHQVSLRFYVIS